MSGKSGRAGTAPASGRRRAAHLGPERRRPLVLDAARSLFVESGYRGTSMEGIAEAAGVTKPVVYKCYPNKEELFRALLEREEQRLLTAVQEALPSDLGAAGDLGSLESVLAPGFTALLKAAQAEPDSWRIVFVSEHGSEPAIARRVQRARTGLISQISAMVEPYLVSVGVKDATRKAPVLSEVAASIAEAGVRTLLSGKGDWSPDELGPYLAQVATHGPAAA